jgi:catechol 2,3-dioxygenase-like lactoylglutathione lyase family enzyme
MSTTDARSSDARANTRVGTFDMKVEVLVLPVADIDRAKEFYSRLGWRLDATPPTVVQFTPPGSWCAVQFGPTLSSAAPGSAKGYLVVSDIVVARDRNRATDLNAPGRRLYSRYWPGTRRHSSEIMAATSRFSVLSR